MVVIVKMFSKLYKFKHPKNDCVHSLLIAPQDIHQHLGKNKKGEQENHTHIEEA
jgi:hypothetical protein